MRLRDKELDVTIPEPDMTPMIDMTFMLIAFFMVVINFTKADQNQSVQLPTSELAVPDQEVEQPLFLHVVSDAKAVQLGYLQESDLGDPKKNRNAIFKGTGHSIAELSAALRSEVELINQSPRRTIKDTNVIIRGDEYAKTGLIQAVIEACKQHGFETFMLRARFENTKD